MDQRLDSHVVIDLKLTSLELSHDYLDEDPHARLHCL